MRHYGWTPQVAKDLSVPERGYWLESMARRMTTAAARLNAGK